MNTSRIRFGENIRARRLAIGSSQSDLAGDAGIDLEILEAIERGDGDPRLDVILRIAIALECDAGELFTGVTDQ